MKPGLWSALHWVILEQVALYSNGDASTASTAAQRAHFYNSITAPPRGSLHSTWFLL